MVLEEASAGQDTSSFSENVPSSDLDPYASSNGSYSPTSGSNYVPVPFPGANTVYINMDNIPRAFSFFGGRQHPQIVIKSIQEQCRFLQTVVQRPIRQEEADALAFHAGKAIRVGSWGFPIGTSLATMQWLRTYKDYRFPGWSPMKSGKNSPDRFGPLRGQAARVTWHSTRYSAYLIAGSILGQVLFGSYAMSLSLAGRAMDPRLKDFMDALQKRQREGVGMQRPPDESDGPRKDETYEMARQRRSTQNEAQSRSERQEVFRNRQAQMQRKKAAADDDMSPTSGAFEEEYMGGGGGSGLMSDSQAREQQYQQPRADNMASSSDASSRSTTQRRSSDSSSTQTPAAGGGSAWDRLRQGAMSGSESSSSSRRAQALQGSSGDNSFSFSQGDEDRQLARSEAQKQFDARIEREREGRDFEDSKGDGGRRKRW